MKKWTIVYETIDGHRIKFELKMKDVDQAVTYTRDVLGDVYWSKLKLHKCYGKEVG